MWLAPSDLLLMKRIQLKWWVSLPRSGAQKKEASVFSPVLALAFVRIKLDDAYKAFSPVPANVWEPSLWSLTERPTWQELMSPGNSQRGLSPAQTK